MDRKVINLLSPPTILVANIIIAIAIGVVCAAKSDDAPYSYIIGILSEIAVLSINIVVMVYKMNSKIIEAVRDSSILVDAGHYAANSKDPGCSEKYNEIRTELTELVKGNYTIKGRLNVYKDDIESIKKLRKNETLYSVSPVGQQEDLIQEDFDDNVFKESMKQLYRAVKKEVIVECIYIFESRSIFENTSICKEHLDKVKKNGVNVKVVYIDEIKKDENIKQAPRDFIIFNQKRVSVGMGTIGSRSSVHSTEIWSSAKELLSNSLWRVKCKE